MKIMREEIFGPVVAIAKFREEEKVIELANDTSYGLAAGIHTKDYERAIRVTGALEAGTTWVNMYNVCSHSHLPSVVADLVYSSYTGPCHSGECPFSVLIHLTDFPSGYKESGIGRECGEHALENYTEVKTVYFNMGIRAPDALD